MFLWHIYLGYLTMNYILDKKLIEIHIVICRIHEYYSVISSDELRSINRNLTRSVHIRIFSDNNSHRGVEAQRPK